MIIGEVLEGGDCRMNPNVTNRKAKLLNLIAAGALVLAITAVWWAASAGSHYAAEPVPGGQDEARRIIVYTTTSVI
jgi:hypothetical protein